MNMHLLIHLSQCVQDWGPLWAYSCFQFWSANNYLKKLFHGTRDMSEQVCFLFLFIFPCSVTVKAGGVANRYDLTSMYNLGSKA